MCYRGLAESIFMEMELANLVIQTEGLTKYYGANRALSGVALEVREGEVFGYLGPNGAGKSTTIRILIDFIRATEGSAKVFGLDSRTGSREIRRRTSYLPGDVILYDKMTARELLEYFANLSGGADWGYVERLADRLRCALDQPIRTLSRGNRQKIGLVQAFMHRSDLIIMDEPSSGLDPLMQQEFYSLVEEVREEGRTVFISSHIMPEVERVCDRVGIIRGGELVTIEDIETLKERALHKVEIHFADPVPAEVFTGLPGVRDAAIEGNVVTCTVVGKPDALVKAAARFEVVKLVSREPNLEELFLSYYGDGGQDAD